MFFFENHMQNVMEKLVPDSFIKFVCIPCPNQGLPKYIKTKMLTTCFCLI